jgi:hypothetical protein
MSDHEGESEVFRKMESNKRRNRKTKVCLCLHSRSHVTQLSIEGQVSE